MQHNGMLRRIARSGLVATMFIGALVAVAAPASASDGASTQAIVCDPGETGLSFSSSSYVRTVTHSMYWTVPTGATVDYETNVTKVSTITAGLTFTTGGGVSADVIFASFEGKVGLELATSGSHTVTTSVTIHWHLGPGHYAVFRGNKKYTGSFSGGKCNSTGTVLSLFSGNAVSYTVLAEGAANCSSTYGSTTFEYKAKQIAC
ncbi:hypothetical protein F4553_002167 [Allocatelliglobosispora scoriae]|uniref:Uncharacterized protein n=1 Tax=Allocatelliglobosispora scoriae TaxID=643052 RepID=A0A841BN28_9ACTN|nr:hypothetical protein [Allocatelliglobosispora scoriae]MBB5868788.1 hypothetical protein [Allocatelliglobosispora scoriae]